MSENVKINIFEKDNTSPAGSGIDSTDIVFIPGFSSLAAAPKNQPTLITSTLEFEKVFGKKPRVLTNKDVVSYSNYGFKAGDFDRSYVYAKELLYQGMPVVYSNVVVDDKQIEFDNVRLKVDSTKTKKDVYEIVYKSNMIEFSFDSVVDEAITLKATATLEVSARDKESKNPTITTYDFITSCTGSADVEVKSFSIDASTIKPKYAVVSLVSDTQVEFVNSTDTAEPVDVEIVIEVHAKALIKSQTATLEIKNNKTSALDAFYNSEKATIETQWAVGTPELPVDYSIADKSVYSVKYITSGGYPSVVSYDKTSAKMPFASQMLQAAAHRGDAVALIDYQLKPEEKSYAISEPSFYSKMHALLDGVANGEYGAAMYPWSTYNCGSTLSFADSALIEMPASFGYMMCLAKAIKSSPNWLAIAGVTRGIVPGISKLLVPGNTISNAVAEEMQPKFGVENHRVSINTITNIRPYGLTLWGNRTLKPVSKEGTVSLNFLNTRNMLSDIKKLLYTTAKACMFEQDSSDLWIKFKNGIEPLLRRLKAGNGISDYQIVRGTTKYNGDPLTKGEIAAVIKVYPMYAVEYFELAVEINDEEVSVS